MDTLLKYVATLGIIGYVPFAPGTFGTLCAFVLFIAVKPSLFFHLALLALFIPLGIISSHHAERTLKVNDSKHIVIDEFCGYLLSVLFMPFSFVSALAAFFLFRVFDILKPFPIRKIESFLIGGIGIMADDIMAAIYTNIILQVIKTVNPGIFSFS
jgi:phosphatidylglycerophosphatase A